MNDEKESVFWVAHALDHFADTKIDEDDFDLRGQYTENRLFLHRIRNDWEKGKLSDSDMQSLEKAFLAALERPDSDVMLSVEKEYLEIFDRQQKSRRMPMAAARGQHIS